MGKKWFPLAKKAQYFTSKNKLFLEKLFPPNSNNGFHQQKNSFHSLFPLDRKSISTIRIKDFLKNMFSLNAKVASALKNLRKNKKIGVFQQECGASLKIDFPLISVTISTSRKSLRIKRYCFQWRKTDIPGILVKTVILEYIFQTISRYIYYLAEKDILVGE